MENSILTQCPEGTVTYDYRMYDRIWQRVSPELDPYPEVRAAAAAAAAPTAPAAPQETPAPQQEVPATAVTAAPAAPVPAQTPAGPAASSAAAAEAQLPGAEMNPCCMGTQARESLNVLEGFIEEELAERRYYLALCRRVRNAYVVRLLRRITAEKQCAARDMCTAYYLITGECYTPAITMDQTQWDSLPAALRFCYHQEACNGLNYDRAAGGTTDPCLQKLFTRLSQQAYKRADELMCALGQILC